MKKNIFVIAAITSASLAIFNLGSASASLEKASTSTLALETWSEVKQNSDSQGNEDNNDQGYTGKDEDGETEQQTTE